MYRARAVLPRAEPEEVHTARGRYYPKHCKNHETADFRPYKATTRLALVPEYSTYYTLAVQRNVLYARRCSYSSIA